MIYLFDKTQTLTGVINEHTETLSATLEMKINEASTLDFALPLDDNLSAKMAGVKYVGVLEERVRILLDVLLRVRYN